MEGVVGEVGEMDWLLFGRFEGFSRQEGPFIEVVDDEVQQSPAAIQIIQLI